MSRFEEEMKECNSVLQNCINNIYLFCKRIDVTELLSYLTLLSDVAFDIKEGYKYMSPLDFEYLMGIILSIDLAENQGKGSMEEIDELFDNLNKIKSAWKLSNSFRKIDGKVEQEIQRALFEANLISTGGIMRGYSMYPPTEEIWNGLFSKYDDFFVKTIGFYVSDISDFNNIIKLFYRGAIEMLRRDLGVEEKQEDDEKSEENIKVAFQKEYKKYLFFTSKDFESFLDEVKMQRFICFLNFFSVELGVDRNDNYRFFNDKNIFKNNPIIKYNDSYLLPAINSITWIIKEKLEGELKKNQSVWKSYCDFKSDYLENMTMDIFGKMFPNAKIFQSLYYDSLEGKRCELDGLVYYDNAIILIEAKSVIYPSSAQNGGVGRLENTLEANIEYAAYQAKRAKDYILNVDIPIFEDKNKRKILEIEKTGFENIFLVNVTMEYFAELSVNLLQLQKLGFVDIKEFPWSVSIGDLKIISEFIQFPNQFLHYIFFRQKFSNKVLIGNDYKHFFELDIFGFYLFEEKEELADYLIEDVNENVIAYNAYNDINNDISSLTPDFSYIFNEYYNKKILGIEADVPHKKYNPEFYDIIRQLEEYSDQGKGYTNIVIKLLDVDNNVQDQIMNLIHKMVEEAKSNKTIRIFSAPYLHGNFDDRSSFGITIIAGFSKDTARMFQVLKATCVKNQYSYKYEEWLGMCIIIDDSRHLVNNFMLLRDDIKFNSEMESLIRKLPAKRVKIGRNDPCPCGSGLKYKKCCGKNT